MKRRTLILTSLLVLVLVSAGWGVHHLWEARLWLFATGTRDSAFLATTFGMSPQEVRRSLATYSAQLLSYQEYRRSEPSPNIDTFGFTPLFSDDARRDASLYMPSVEMFESKVEAEFGFRDERLSWVEVYFDPIAHRKSEAVVSTIESGLRSTHRFSGREESQEVPGAYTLHFASASASPSLWVNLTKPDKPIIILTVVHPTTQADRKREIENRQRKAFGVKK